MIVRCTVSAALFYNRTYANTWIPFSRVSEFYHSAPHLTSISQSVTGEELSKLPISF